MKRFIVFLLLLLTVAACKPSIEHPQKPQHLLPEDKMVEVITDFNLVEAAVRQLTGFGKNPEVISKYYYSKVLRKYNLTADDFQQNLRYYAQDPEKIHDIYSRVVTRLSEMQQEISDKQKR